jgi:hypothetical protein
MQCLRGPCQRASAPVAVRGGRLFLGQSNATAERGATFRLGHGAKRSHGIASQEADRLMGGGSMDRALCSGRAEGTTGRKSTMPCMRSPRRSTAPALISSCGSTDSRRMKVLPVQRSRAELRPGAQHQPSLLFVSRTIESSTPICPPCTANGMASVWSPAVCTSTRS